MSNLGRQRGTTLIEILLTLPVLIILTAGAIELSRAMTTYASAAALLREVTSNAYKRLGANAFLTTTQDDPNLGNRLQSMLQDVSGALQQVHPGLEVSLSMYRAVDLGAGPQPRRVGFATNSALPGGRTQVNASQFLLSNDPMRNDLLVEQQVLVYGEVWVTFVPVLSSFFNLFGFGERQLYVVACF